jgi:hypothetical protein
VSRRINDESSSGGEPNVKAPRIVMQYFRGQTLVCELKSAGESLRLHISPRDRGENGEEGWQIEAHAKVADQEVMVGALGTTRRAAFTEMRSKWSTQAPELGLGPVDWDAVAVALASVRAIE